MMSFNLMNVTFSDFVKENLILVLVLAAILVLIVVLAVIMIVLQKKAKALAAETPAEEAPAEAPAEPAASEAPEEAETEAPAEKPEEAETEASAEKPEETVAAAEKPEEAVVSKEAPEEEVVVEDTEDAEAAAEEEEVVVEDAIEPAAEPVKEEESASVAEEEVPGEEEVKEEDMKKTPAGAPKEEAASKPEKSALVFKPGTAKESAPEKARASAAGGKWMIENRNGKFWLSLYAPNGQVMLESPAPGYATLSSARSGIKTYQDNIAAGRLELTTHKNGDVQVLVLNARHGLLAASSTYSSKNAAESAMESIKRWAATTTVEETTAE